MSAEFDINAHLRQARFGEQTSGSGGDGGGADTWESLGQKGVDKTVQNAAKVSLSWLGIHVNTDIEGKSMFAGLDPQAVANSMALTSAALINVFSGGNGLFGLGAMLDKLMKYFSRELPSAVAAPIEAGAAGGGGDSGGFSDGGGSAMMAGGGDIQGMAGVGGAPDMPDVPQINYGGKMMTADLADLGTFRPDPTPVVRGGGLDVGGGVGMG